MHKYITVLKSSNRRVEIELERPIEETQGPAEIARQIEARTDLENKEKFECMFWLASLRGPLAVKMVEDNLIDFAHTQPNPVPAILVAKLLGTLYRAE